MHDKATTKNPIANLSIPPYAPRAVLDPYAQYTRVSDAWALKLGEIQDAKQEKKDAVAVERQRITEAALKGELVESHVADIEAAHDKKLAALHDVERAFANAVHVKGNCAAEVIEAHAPEWAEKFPPLEAAAIERVRAGLAELGAGIAEVSAARGAMRWLREFDYVQAVGGNVHNFNGVPLLIDHGSLSRNDNPTNANRLLDMFGQIGG